MKKEEQECVHEYAPLMAKHKGKVIALERVSICLNCGILKVGTNTIKISNERLDMGDKPINNASKVIINSRLKIPVGTDMYDES
jgi:Zn-finger protein